MPWPYVARNTAACLSHAGSEDRPKMISSVTVAQEIINMPIYCCVMLRFRACSIIVSRILLLCVCSVYQTLTFTHFLQYNKHGQYYNI